MIKGQNLQQEYQQGCLSDSMEKSKSLQTSKAKRIQHHQTSFATNAKGHSPVRKENATTKNKKIMNRQSHQ